MTNENTPLPTIENLRKGLVAATFKVNDSENWDANIEKLQVLASLAFPNDKVRVRSVFNKKFCLLSFDTDTDYFWNCFTVEKAEELGMKFYDVDKFDMADIRESDVNNEEKKFAFNHDKIDAEIEKILQITKAKELLTRLRNMYLFDIDSEGELNASIDEILKTWKEVSAILDNPTNEIKPDTTTDRREPYLNT